MDTHPITDTPAATVLVVDDASNLAESYTEFLRKNGYKAETAGGVGSALDRIARGGIGCVVSDFNMHDAHAPHDQGSGLDLLEKIRAQGHNMPFILVSTSPVGSRYSSAPTPADQCVDGYITDGTLQASGHKNSSYILEQVNRFFPLEKTPGNEVSGPAAHPNTNQSPAWSQAYL